jgi:multimeric flavodoxin WrbA
MKLKLLGIDCSPRDKSNSNAILQDSFAYAKENNEDEIEYQVVNLRAKKIEHCRACNVCGKNKETGEFMDCVLAQTDEVQEVLDLMVEADGLAIATPVYFGMPSDLFSKFIMRTRVLRHQDFKLANKPVGVMAIAGRRSGGAETTIISSWLPFIRNGCLIVGNGDKTCQFGTMGWAGGREQILNDEWGLEQGRQTVQRIIEVAKIVKSGKAALNYQEPMQFCYKSGTR